MRKVRLHLAPGARGARGANGAVALVLLCAVLSSTAVVAAQSKPQPGRPTAEQDLAAITGFNRKYLKAINDGDIATLSSLTDEGHIMITPGRPPLIGKAANDAANGRAFQTVKIDETWTPVETVVSGDLAYQRGTYTVAATPKAGGNTTKTSGHFLRIYRRQPNGEWRMTHDTFNSVPEPGSRGQGAVAQ